MVISSALARRETGEARRLWGWSAACAAALLAAAAWLRAPSIPYLATAVAATTIAALLSARRRWAWAACVALVAFVAVAAVGERELRTIERDWPEYSRTLARQGTRALLADLAASATSLRTSAERALLLPDESHSALEAELPATLAAERGIVVYRDGRAIAWAGRMRTPVDTGGASLAVTRSAFYVTLRAIARRGRTSAVAAVIVHAEPPADRLAVALDRLVEERTGAKGFDFDVDAAARTPNDLVFAPAGVPLLTARALPPVREEVRLHALERARARGVVALGAALLCFLAVLWGHPAPLARRLAAIAVAVAVVAIVPLNSFSNVTPLFDPGVYYAPFGGPLTASVGALGLTSGLLLLGLLAVLRSPGRLPNRWLAGAIVLAAAGFGPFLLRYLARGITPPTWGATINLWLAWEVAIFLAAVGVLLTGASAGRAALRGRRGFAPRVAATLAILAALLGPLVWNAPGRWPGWYPVLWIAAIAALALTRRSRGFVFTTAVVAGCGAATLVWGETIRKRVELAAHDVVALGEPDQDARVLLERFADALRADDPPRTRADLLKSYALSDLAAAGYPVALSAWSATGEETATLDMAARDSAPAETVAAVADARRSGAPSVAVVQGQPGVSLLLAVPHSSGDVTTALVAPRTRLVPDDPFSTLLGVAPETAAEPPYSLALTDAPGPSTGARASGDHWKREGSELHGDWVVGEGASARRAHVEVELRTLDALVQRGGLLLLLDLGVILCLWTVSAVADGGFARWLRLRQRGWARSYRMRLTIALFAFFVLPAAVFAVWSYRRLQSDDRQSRELLVSETLRAAAGASDAQRLPAAGERLTSPLLLYSGGELQATSDELYTALAPIGRFLDPEVENSVDVGDEVMATSSEQVGPVRALFGYRATGGGATRRVVLAAPARTNELSLDRRRRDLGILVLFATALGAAAALWLSGIAAREFSRPIGALRRAALAIAAGGREPELAGEPPAEFGPVFSAFRRMASDLSASRSALEEAQRRTAAVLRDVASGVVAVDSAGRVTLSNPRAEAVLGAALRPGDALAAPDAPDAPDLGARVAAFIARGGDEEEFDLSSGGRQLHARLTRLARSGGGAVLTLDDVTEIARAQRVLAWGEMARQIAHEIKNPLTPIRLGVQHLRRAHADRRPDFDRILGQNVERILAEIDRLDEIARAFSRYGSAPTERPAAEPIEVASVLRDVVALERLGESAVAWSAEGTDMPAPAMAREAELREVLLNVLENARLAHARGVRAAVSRTDGHVTIAIEDDGDGIPPDVLPRIFEPHFSTRTSGSGLGLAISRRLIDGWGGEISVSSERGKGTRVEIRLRAAAPHEA